MVILGQALLDPVKVSISGLDDDEHTSALVRETKAEMRSLGRFGIVEKNADIVVVVTAAPIEGMSCSGFAAVMMSGSGRDKKSDRISIHTAADMRTLAKHLVEKLKAGR